MRWLFLALFLLAGCATSQPRHVAEGPPPDIRVFVLVHDWHTEISVPTAQLTGGLTRFKSIFPDARYLSFGFGERLYFQKNTTGAIDKISAIFPGAGTVLTTALAGPPSEMYKDLEMVSFLVNQGELDRLADFLWDSFEKTPDGQLHKLGDGRFPGYVFYGATPVYSGFYTCNTWMVDGLERAGLDVDPAGVILASQVMERVRALAAQRGG